MSWEHSKKDIGPFLFYAKRDRKKERKGGRGKEEEEEKEQRERERVKISEPIETFITSKHV